MMPTQGPRSSGGGKALAIGAGLLVGGMLLFSGGSSSAAAPAPATPVDPCKDLEAKATDVIDKATKADIVKLTELMDLAKMLGCTDLAAKIAKKISDLGPIVVLPLPKPKGGFNSNLAPSPVDAHIIAVNIGNTPANSATPAEFVASNGTYVDLKSYAKYFDPLAVAAHLTNLQRNSGIKADGIYGPQTEAAFTWFYWRAARADGSTDTRGVTAVAGDSDPLCTSCGSEMSASVEGCSACGMKKSQIEALREERVEVAVETGVGFGGKGFGGGGAIMGDRAAVGGYFPARPFGELALAPVTINPVTIDFINGYRLGLEDVRRVRAGATVYMAAFITTAGADYLTGYKTGVADKGGLLITEGGKTRVMLPKSSYFGGGLVGAGKGYVGVRGEASPAQVKALRSLEALRSAVAGEFSGLIDAASVVIAQGRPIDISQIPVVPGSESIIECLHSFNTDVRIGQEQAPKTEAEIEAEQPEQSPGREDPQFGSRPFGQSRR